MKKRSSSKSNKRQSTSPDLTITLSSKNAQTELEGKWCSLVQNISDIILMIDHDGRIQAINRMVDGYAKEDILESTVYDFVAADYHHVVKESLDKVFQTGEPSNYEVIGDGINGPDSSWYEVRIAAIRQNGIIDSASLIATDITAHKKANEELQFKEAYYQALIENAMDVIMIMNKDGTIRYESPSAHSITGYKPEERVGKSVFDLIHPDDMPKALSTFSGLLKNEVSTLHMEFRLRHMDDSWHTIEVIGNNLFDDPIIAGIVTNFRDITERKNAEDALKKSEEKFKRFVEEMNDGYCVIQDFFIVFVNARGAEMFGYTTEEVIGRSIQDLIPYEIFSQLAEVHTRRKQGENVPPQYETVVTKKDGAECPVELGSRIIYFNDRPAVSVVIRDISDRKQAENEKEKLEHQLQLAGRLAAVGELAAGVAHELNNPLAAVQGYCEFLASRKDLEESLKKDVEVIYREAQRASRITGNLLSFARRHEPEKNLVSLNEAVAQSLDLNAYRMKVNNIKVDVELDPNLPLTLADFHQMQQVFVNIITNAEQAMTESHGKGNLSVKTQSVDDMIRIEITDDGPGISKVNLSKLFDPFFTTKEVGKGTGLGLSICYGIVEQHGGQLYAKSKLGRCTTFFIEIPIITEDQATPEQTDLSEVEII